MSELRKNLIEKEDRPLRSTRVIQWRYDNLSHLLNESLQRLSFFANSTLPIMEIIQKGEPNEKLL